MRARMPHTHDVAGPTPAHPHTLLCHSLARSLSVSPLRSIFSMLQISFSCSKFQFHVIKSHAHAHTHAHDYMRVLCVCVCVQPACGLCSRHSFLLYITTASILRLPLAFATLIFYFGVRLFRCFVAVSHTLPLSPTHSLSLTNENHVEGQRVSENCIIFTYIYNT